MAGDFWKKLGVGTNYDQINQALGGIPDFVKNTIAPAAMAGISSFDKSMSESLPGQIGGAIGNQIAGAIQPGAQEANQQAIQGTEQLRQEHPIASGIGQVGAAAGQMLTTPTLPGAGAGAGILPVIGRQALNAAGVAIPSAIAQGVQTGDVGGALESAALNTGLGTALGTGAEKGAEVLTPLLNKIQAKAMGLNTRNVKQTINALANKQGKNVIGSRAARGEGVIQDIVDLGNKFGAWFQKGKQALWDHMTNGYKTIAKLYDAGAPNIADALPQIAQDGNLNQARQIFGNKAVDDELLNQAGQIEKMGWTDARLHTGDMMSAAFKERQPDLPVKLKGAVAGALHDYLGDTAQSIVDVAHQAGNTAIPNLHDLDAVYGAAKAIHGAEATEAIGLPATFSPGSDTAARVGVQNLVMHGLGAAEGAGLAAITGFDPNDPSSYPMALAKVMGSSVAGRMINRGAAKMGEVGGGLAARGLQAGLEAAQPLAPRIAQAGAKLTSIGQQEGEQEMPDIQQPAPQSTASPSPAMPRGQMEGTDWQTGAGTPPPSPVEPEHKDIVQQVTQKEQSMSPEQVAQAKAAVFAPMKDRIVQTLKDKYDNWQNPYKMDWDRFLKDAEQKSNNFDPKNTYTAKFIAGDDYKKYVRDYQVALNLNNMGRDLHNVLAYGIGLNHPLGLGAPDIKAKHDELVDTIYTAMTGETKPPDTATRKIIQGKLYTLAKGGGNQKQKLLQMLSDEYGVNFDMLKQYGMTP